MTPYYPLIYDQENLHYCIVKHILQYPHPHVYTRQTDWPSKKVLQVTFTLKNIVKSHHQHANKKVIPFQCFPFVTINLANIESEKHTEILHSTLLLRPLRQQPARALAWTWEKKDQITSMDPIPFKKIFVLNIYYCSMSYQNSCHLSRYYSGIAVVIIRIRELRNFVILLAISGIH